MDSELAAFAVAGDEPIAGSVVVGGEGETFDVGEALEEGDGTIVVVAGSNLEHSLNGFAGLKREKVPEGAQPVNADEAPPPEVKASDAAKRKASELNVDLSTVDGSGSNGAITVKDVEEAADPAAGDGTGNENGGS